MSDSEDEKNKNMINVLQQRNLDAIFDKDEYGGDMNPFKSELLANRRNNNFQKKKFIESNKKSSDYKERNECQSP